MKDRDEYIAEVKKLKISGQSDSQILGFLRTQGCSLFDSIVIMRFACEISLGEAKRIVHTSDVWNAERDAHERFQKIAEDVLNGTSDKPK